MQVEFAKLRSDAFEYHPSKVDSNGLEYHRWMSDIELYLTALGILATIREYNETLEVQPTTAEKARALVLMRRHMDASLLWDYMSIENPRELWLSLEARFGKIKDALLFDLKAKWSDLRFLDFKTVAEYNSVALCIRSMLHCFGVELTEGDLIEKTLSTFPNAAIVLSMQYRFAYDSQLITQFQQLMNFMLRAEKHNLLVTNHNTRPVGTQKVHDANYSSVSKRKRKQRNAAPQANHGQRRKRSHQRPYGPT
ncbi:uncharacterized protein LOC126792190 [Argentina anserina]|uniref:uncharacterized protein LOC126792190 n=1 Tax=Argentina anserina TaxID=57926 RepID=UPI0021766454|nr:uncharacterized protein LOC126792190 [Potentilla anserina]